MNISQMEPNKDPSEEDYSLTILKNRLAKGEITVQEFDELKKKLETNSVKELKDEIRNVRSTVERIQDTPKEVSNAWYLVPLFLALFGGVIMYFLTYRDDKRKALNGLVLGIVMTAIILLFFWH